jgi:hypothetical protein
MSSPGQPLLDVLAQARAALAKGDVLGASQRMREAETLAAALRSTELSPEALAAIQAEHSACGAAASERRIELEQRAEEHGAFIRARGAYGRRAG